MCYYNSSFLIIAPKEGVTMKIENLKIFLEVAQAESMNEAARNLFMSHQNLNKIIRNLETELNTQLFVRSNKGIQLTGNGKELFITASQIVRNYDSFLEKLNSSENDIIKFYTIHAHATLAGKLQGKQLGDRYISVYKRDFEEITKMIQRGKTGIYFLPVTGDNFVCPPETASHIVTASDLIIGVCHKNYLEQYAGKTLAETSRLINSASKIGLDGIAIGIDDVQLCKTLMREEGFAYSNEYQLFRAEFPEDEWEIFSEESMPDYKVAYTLFFNLPDTIESQQLQQNIIKYIEAFFFEQSDI